MTTFRTLTLATAFAAFTSAAVAEGVVVSSKIDTEGGLLGNLIYLALEDAGIAVENKLQLGGTPIVRSRMSFSSAASCSPLRGGSNSASSGRTVGVRSALVYSMPVFRMALRPQPHPYRPQAWTRRFPPRGGETGTPPPWL